MNMENTTEVLAASFDLVARQDEAEKAITVLRSDVDEVKARLDQVSRAAARPVLDGVRNDTLAPVHARANRMDDGSLLLEWCRRSRGSWQWLDGVGVPLNEQAESYVVGIGDSDAPDLRWETGTPRLQVDASTWTSIRVAHASKPLWVRQVGTHALSLPLLLTTIT